MLQFSDLTIEKAVANQSGAMETRDHFKNGASSKSQMSRGYFYRKVCFALLAACIIFSGCDDKDDENDNKTSTVTFNSNGGSEVSSQTIKNGEKVIEPKDPTRSGYTFDAWYKEEKFTTEWKFDIDVVNSDVTLYAKWLDNGNSNGNEVIKFKKVDIANAIFIFKSESDKTFYKTDINGKNEPIQFIDENDNKILFPIQNIIDVNSEFLWFLGTFETADEDGNSTYYINLLVNKKSGEIFVLPNSLSIDNARFSTDAKENIWLISGGVAYYKISTVDYTVEEYSLAGHNAYNILIDKNELCFYHSSTGHKIKHPSGRIVLMSDLIEDYYPWSAGYNGNRDNFILGNDGFFYDVNLRYTRTDDETFMGKRIDFVKIYRMDDVNNDVKATLVSEIDVFYENGNNYFRGDVKINYINNSLLLLTQPNPYNNETNLNTLYEFNCTNNTWRYFQPDISGFRVQEFVSKNALYFISENKNSFVRLDLNTYVVSSLTLTGFEIYEISSSIASDEISFAGLRFVDGKNIIGVIDTYGNIKSIIESENNSKIEKLIQLK